MEVIQSVSQSSGQAEHRWANRLRQDVETWRSGKNRVVEAGRLHAGGTRPVAVVVKRSRTATGSRS